MSQQSKHPKASDRATSGIRIYAGPNCRCNFAAVELQFPVSVQGVDRQQLERKLALLNLQLTLGSASDSLEFAEALVRVAAILQQDPGSPIAWGNEGASSWVCIGYTDPPVASAALRLAGYIVQQVGQGSDKQLQDAVARHLAVARSTQPDQVSQLVHQEAALRHIPVYALTTLPRVWQLGQGAAARPMYFSGDHRDSLTGIALAKSKFATAEWLKKLGYPGPDHRRVEDETQAVLAAGEIGYPCVVKPANGGLGRGVSVGIVDEAELRQAYKEAKRFSRSAVLIERRLSGDDHRLTVMGGRLCLVYRRRPPVIQGDGKHSIERLIHRFNTSRQHLLAMGACVEVRVDIPLQQLLAKQGFGLDSVPGVGVKIRLRGPSNASLGGETDDMGDTIHPDNIALAEHIAAAARLNCCGLDFITDDISRSWREGNCAFIEINETPGFWGIADACTLLDMADAGDGRLPSFLVLEDDHVGELISAAVQSTGRCCGLTTNRQTVAGASVLPGAMFSDVAARTRALVIRPDVEALVVVCTREEVTLQGMPLDYFDVIVVGKGCQLTPELDALLRRNCKKLVRPDEQDLLDIELITTTVLTERSHNAVPDWLQPGEVTSTDNGQALLLSVKRLPCITLQELAPALRPLLPDFDGQGARSALLTQEVAVHLAWSLACTAIVDAGASVPVLCGVRLVAKPLLAELRHVQYEITATDMKSAAFSLAMQWSLQAINSVLDGTLFKRLDMTALLLARQQTISAIRAQS